MPTIIFYLDFVSPYAYLAFHRLPQVLQGLAWQVKYQPVVLGGLFKAQGNTSPAAVPAKHAWVLRHAQWLAQQQDLPFVMPAQHPFNPIIWLRMALASSPHGQTSRQVCETLFNAIWQHGHDADDPAVQQQAWDAATSLLPTGVRSPQNPEVKDELINAGQRALAHAVFGVPSFVLLPDEKHPEPEMFWGVEGMPMLREAVASRQLVTSGAA